MNFDDLRVLSVLSVLGHPRDSKRIAMLKQVGFAVEAVAFERDYHSGRMPDCPVDSLGKIPHGHYTQRLVKMAMVLPKMRRAMRRNDIVYASGEDMAFLALLVGFGLGKPVVVEIGDIREIQVAPGLKGRLIRIIDKHFVNSCSLLVATAPGFIDTYYRQWLKSSVPAMVIENKLESAFVEKIISKGITRSLKGKPLVDRPLRIGYFGGLRCEWSWRVLKTFAIGRPQDVEIVLAGYPMNPINLSQQVEKYDNIQYIGQYRSPQDLPALYNSVDLIWGCYQPIGHNDWNLRWARPNRFYESCFFQVPIVSRSGSCDSVDVERYNIGLIIKDEVVEKVVDTLCSIKLEHLETWKKNMSTLPRSVYSYTTEAEELKRELEAIAEDRVRFKKQSKFGGIDLMNTKPSTEPINCPYCNESKSLPWARENGFTAVKCSGCGLVYVNPRPILSLISEAVQTGVHSNVEHGRTAVVRRVKSNVIRYKKILALMFNDVWQNSREISWLDVGAGYGEVVEAVSALAPAGSRIEGIEPMKPKAIRAREHGLKISEKYLCDVTEKFDFVSLVNVYSHIPDFRVFLEEIKNVLADNGEFYLETGNIADLANSCEVPTELDLPDHLVFAGEQQLTGYLSEAGFSIMEIKRMRKDGFVNFAKNIIKKLIGRKVALKIPYTSRYRSILIRSKLRSSPSA